MKIPINPSDPRSTGELRDRLLHSGRNVIGLTLDEAQAIEAELSTFGEIYTAKGKLHLSGFEGKTLRDLARDILKQKKESSS